MVFRQKEQQVWYRVCTIINRRSCASVATVADGIAVKEPGKITFETCSNYVDEIVTVSEDEICAAILKLIESEKMVARRCWCGQRGSRDVQQGSGEGQENHLRGKWR